MLHQEFNHVPHRVAKKPEAKMRTGRVICVQLPMLIFQQHLDGLRSLSSWHLSLCHRLVHGQMVGPTGELVQSVLGQGYARDWPRNKCPQNHYL